MLIKKPKELYWTEHSKIKMRFYGLSASRVRRVLHTPARIEEGIAPNTIAMMQSIGSKKHPAELWVMIAETDDKKKIISAWRYSGVTKPRSQLLLNILNQEYGEFNNK